jgi:phosphoglycerate kinase
MKTLKEFDFQNKKVLVRCDFNVPLDERGNILDDFRLKQAIPTIGYLAEKGAKTILMSHLDSPGGKVVENLRLNPVQDWLMQYLDFSIAKTQDCVGAEVKEWANNMKAGDILLLENLRFHKEEEENDDNFAKELAGLGELYVNEAFSVSHRKHASVVGIPKHLPSAAGFLFEREINILKELVENPKRPLTVIIGGKKAESKAKLIEKFSKVADWVLVSGLVQKEINEKGLKFSHQEKIISPKGNLEAFDLNQETVKIFTEKINSSKTVFWNGPLGKTEDYEYVFGSKSIAQAIINSGAYSVAGGGETLEFINKLGLAEKFNHVSSGGGAMLDYLADGELPGLTALK